MKVGRYIGAVLGIALMVFFGCKGKSENAGGTEGTEKIVLELVTQHTPETAKESVTIRGYLAMKEKFLKDNPNVVLNETALQQTDMHTKLMALAAADEMPDYFCTKGSWVQNFYDNNLMADLSGKIDPGIYREGLLGPFTKDGRLFAVPYQFQITSMCYYNEKLWKEIGYDKFPETWDELLEADKRFKAKGITTIALGNKDRWPFESCIISTLGDRITGSEWTRSIIDKNGKAKFTDPDFIKVLEISQQWASLFNVNFNEIVNNQSDVLYCTGRAASTFEGNWTVSYLLSNADKEVLDNTRLAYVPSFSGQKGAKNTTSGGSAWSYSVNSKLTGEALDAAVKYIDYTTGTDYSQYLMDDEGQPGPVPVLSKPDANISPIAKLYIDWLETIAVVPIYDAEMEGAVIDVMNSRIQELLNGTMSPRDVAAAIQAEQDKL
jgi:raffinose/stachyose/melibiose transport system substrate-binding protein